MQKTTILLTLLCAWPAGLYGQNANACAPIEMRPSPGDIVYTVTIDDTHSITNGAMKTEISMNLKFVSPMGIAGPYKGRVTTKTTNDMSAMGGTVSAPFTNTIKDMEWTLVQQGDQWFKTGTIEVASAGPATVSAAGGSGGRRVVTKTSLPYRITIDYPDAMLDVMVPGVGTLGFEGDVKWEPTRAYFARASHSVLRSEIADFLDKTNHAFWKKDASTETVWKATQGC